MVSNGRGCGWRREGSAVTRMASHKAWWLPLAWLAMVPSAGAAGGSVLVVRGSELAPHRAVEQAFLGSLGQPARTVVLGQGDPRQQVRTAAAGAGVIFAIGSDAATAAADIKGTGLIYALVPSPATSGLEPRAAGVSMFASPAQQVRYLRAALPKARRVGILFDPAQSRALVAECEAAAAHAGLTVVREQVTSRRDVAGAARSLADKIDVLWLVPDVTVVSGETFKFLVELSFQTQVPIMGFSEAMTRAGALLSVEATYADMGRKAAALARRLLAGGSAATEAPDSVLYVNAKTAELLNVSLPASVRSGAAKVFD